jgi:hypothetical protein
MTGKIAAEAVKAGKLAKYAVANDRIQDGSVSGAKIVNGAITTSKLGLGAVGAKQLAKGSVGAAKLGAINVRPTPNGIGANSIESAGSECLPGEKLIGVGVFWSPTGEHFIESDGGPGKQGRRPRGQRDLDALDAYRPGISSASAPRSDGPGRQSRRLRQDATVPARPTDHPTK